MSSLCDFDAALANLVPTMCGKYIYVFSAQPLPQGLDVFAQINEDRGSTYIIEMESAKAAGLTSERIYTRITLDVGLDLESIGFTSAIAAQLTAQSIPCNVITGIDRDHILVPSHRSNEAIETLRMLSEQAKGWMSY